MSDVATLLPPNATAGERALEQATARVGAVPVVAGALWNAQTCPLELLPWLAWAWRVDEWDSTWPEAVKRAVVAASIANHKIKGTLASMETALAVAGYPNAQIIEGDPVWNLDGTVMLDGSHDLGNPANWPYYRVILSAPIANSQADQVKRILAATQPARCYLLGLDFTQAAFILNGTVLLDGSYNLGVAG
ncbi:phage tail protein I [Acidocella sp. MX-AZ02]|uniref:phage tail protein I n=1 Tax=Acidocella sp. MX-AZ02 TaxID=1214225 RepID=UPI0003498B58|nr:phage tail protein I [Acidocella sp. MX-AZ02]